MKRCQLDLINWVHSKQVGIRVFGSRRLKLLQIGDNRVRSLARRGNFRSLIGSPGLNNPNRFTFHVFTFHASRFTRILNISTTAIM